MCISPIKVKFRPLPKHRKAYIWVIWITLRWPHPDWIWFKLPLVPYSRQCEIISYYNGQWQTTAYWVWKVFFFFFTISSLEHPVSCMNGLKRKLYSHNVNQTMSFYKNNILYDMARVMQPKTKWLLDLSLSSRKSGATGTGTLCIKVRGYAC